MVIGSPVDDLVKSLVERYGTDSELPHQPHALSRTSEIGSLLIKRAELVFGKSAFPSPMSIERPGLEQPLYAVRLRNRRIAVYDPRIATFRIEVDDDWYPVYVPLDAEASLSDKSQVPALRYPSYLRRLIDRAIQTEET